MGFFRWKKKEIEEEKIEKVDFYNVVLEGTTSKEMTDLMYNEEIKCDSSVHMYIALVKRIENLEKAKYKFHVEHDYIINFTKDLEDEKQSQVQEMSGNN